MWRRVKVHNPTGSRARFVHEKIEPKSHFDPRSFRTIKNPHEEIIIGCPKGKWSPGREMCKVGTRAVAILRSKGNPHKPPRKHGGFLLEHYMPGLRTKKKFETFEGKKKSPAYKTMQTFYDPQIAKSIKRHKAKSTKRKSFLNPTAFSAAFADQVASKLVGKLSKISIFPKKRKSTKKRKNPHLAIIGSLNPKRKRRTMAKRRRNVQMGFYDDTGFHPIRASSDYSSQKSGETWIQRRHKAKMKKKSSPKRRRRNPARLGRDSKGRFLKRRTPKRRRRSIVHRRRTRRNAPKIRRVRRTRNVVRRKYHNRKRRVTKMAAKRVHRRRRKHNVGAVHHRRRRYTKATNPRKRRYSRRRVRHNRRHRRNAGFMSGLIGRVDFKSVAFVAAGVFLGDKLSGILTDKVMTYIGGVTGTSDTTRGFVKLAVGVVASGLIWKFQPALGLGVAVGATNALLNQYVFAPLWGMQATYTGIQGMGDYVNRPWKLDNWAGQAAGVAGLGRMNPLLQKSL